MNGSPKRVDMHCHSTASEVSRLGVQRAVGLPECATPPEEVYELAKRRDMDFVTITDHDTIAGVLQIADRPDVFVSEELTTHFRGEPQAVHVLCYGITPEDHEYLQAHSLGRGGLRALSARAGHPVRAGSPVLRGRGAADGSPPAAPGAAVRGLGDAQRIACEGAEPPRRDVRGDDRPDRHRRQRRPRGRRHRADLDRGSRGGGPVGVPRARARRRGGGGGRGLRGRAEMGARGDRPGGAARSVPEPAAARRRRSRCA